MEWVHCNCCVKTPGSDLAFFMTACGHVLCKKCARKDDSATPGLENNCRVCKTKTRFLEINSNLKSDLQIYFRDPKELASQYMSKLKTVMDFQEKQRSSFVRSQRERCNKAVQCAKEMQATLKKRSTVEKQMLAERTELKAEIKNLEAQLAEKEKEIERIKARVSSQNPPLVPHNRLPSLNGHTPMRTLTFTEVAHSTPLEQLYSKRKTMTQTNTETNRHFFNNESFIAGSDIGVSTPVMLGIKRSTNPRSPYTPSKRLFD